MHILVNIDDDVLGAVKELAARERHTVGRVLSGLARKALCPPARKAPEMRNGFLLLPRKKGIVPPELGNRLLDEEP